MREKRFVVVFFDSKKQSNQNRKREIVLKFLSFLESEFEMLCVVCVPMALKVISRKGFLSVDESKGFQIW